MMSPPLMRVILRFTLFTLGALAPGCDRGDDSSRSEIVDDEPAVDPPELSFLQCQTPDAPTRDSCQLVCGKNTIGTSVACLSVSGPTELDASVLWDSQGHLELAELPRILAGGELVSRKESWMNGVRTMVVQRQRYKRKGEYILYGSDGHVQTHATYHDDELHGLWSQYDADGKLECICQMDMGRVIHCDGPRAQTCKYHHQIGYRGHPIEAAVDAPELSLLRCEAPDTPTKDSCQLICGKDTEGTIREVDFPEGQHLLVTCFPTTPTDENRAHVHWDAQGNPLELILPTIVAGELVSREASWRNGVLNQVEHRQRGKLNGESISYLDNGQVYIRAMYHDDELHGPWSRYNRDGSLECTCQMHMGRGVECEGPQPRACMRRHQITPPDRPAEPTEGEPAAHAPPGPPADDAPAAVNQDEDVAGASSHNR